MLNEVRVFDVKGAIVSANVEQKDRHLFVGTQRLSPGIYFVQLTKAIKKKFIIR